MLLPRAAISYGFAFMAPNSFDKKDSAFRRPLTLSDGSSSDVEIAQPDGAGTPLVVTHTGDSSSDEEVMSQCCRMLRIGYPHEDDAIARFAELCPMHAANGLGRIFRSPTFFEDIVKQISLTNVQFGRSLEMNRLLCEHVGSNGRSFPSPNQLANCSEEFLKTKCKVGYRASRIIANAKLVATGEVDERLLHKQAANVQSHHDALALQQRLQQLLHGVGPYSGKNLCVMLGVYHLVPADTETVRHLNNGSGSKEKVDSKNVDRIVARMFDEYEPVQFLAFWSGLWLEYERAVGRRAHEMTASDHSLLTASELSKRLATSSKSALNIDADHDWCYGQEENNNIVDGKETKKRNRRGSLETQDVQAEDASPTNYKQARTRKQLRKMAN